MFRQLPAKCKSFKVIDDETFQSMAFIAGYCVHQFFKSQKIQDCRLCLDFLTADRDLLFDPEESIKYKLIEILAGVL